MAGKRKRTSIDGVDSESVKGNPLETPKSSYHLGVLEPFLTVWETEGSLEALGKKNKFYGGLMRLDTLKAVTSLLSERLVLVESVYGRQKTEGNMRAWHHALIEMFFWMSTPSEPELRELREKFQMTRDVVGLEMLDELDDDSELKGFNLDIGMGGWRGTDVGLLQQQEEQQTGAQRQQGVLLTTGRDTSEEQIDRVQTGIKFKAHKSSILEDPKLSRRPRSQLKTELCPCIVECKPTESDLAVFQDVGYGVTEVRHNIDHGHYDPLYLPVFAGAKFTYAVLDVHGLVEVSGNSISPASYEKYEEYCAEKGSSPKKKEELELCLANGIEELKLWKDCGLHQYPNAKYVVGDVHIAEKWYSLPTGDTGYSSPQARLFVEAMLRVVVGDKVLCWTPDDARRAHYRREKYINLKRRRCGVSDQDEELSRLADPVLRHRLGSLLAELKSRQEDERLFRESCSGAQPY